MKGTIITCGVYGFTADAFEKAIVGAKTDMFVDVRRRRGVRGHDYAFANSVRLQKMLASHNIPYVHRLDLATSEANMQYEGEYDKAHHIDRHDRSSLSPHFVETYDKDVLNKLDAKDLIHSLGDNVTRPLFFCVERVPAACHRGLIATFLVDQLGWKRLDLEP